MTDATTVTILIDGREVTVPGGTNVVDAARRVGIEIPIFCHHPLLEPVGMCRMCLVEVGRPRRDRTTKEVLRDDDGAIVIDFAPKPEPGCTTFATEGLRVRTVTPAVAEARLGVLELLLTSHPLDCPVCDKGGECPLQNLTVAYGPGRSQFPWAAKYRFPKPVPLGPLVALDRERCVLCARCIRFQDEIASDPVLDFAHRGRGMEIVSVGDPPFKSYFSGNTTDVCPVGALTTMDFRFAARAWEVAPVDGVCVHCAVGCNLTRDVRSGRVVRVMPRQNDAVNELWLCDKGRFAHHYSASDERLQTPLVRDGDALRPASWAEALGRVHDGLAEVVRRRGAPAVGGIAGDGVANEGLYMFGRFLRGVVGTNNVDHRPGILRDDIVARAGAGADTVLTALGAGAAVLVVGLDVEEEAPVLYLNLHKAARRGAAVVVVGGRPQKLDADAGVTLRWSYGGAAALVACLVRETLARAGPGAGAAGSSGARAEGARAGGRGTAPGSASNGAVALAAAVEGYGLETLAGAHPVRPRDMARAADLLATADSVLALYGVEAAELGLAPALAGLTTALGGVGTAGRGVMAVGRHCNCQGAADMGLLPDWLPGYRRLDDAGARSALGGVWPGAPPPGPGLAAPDMLAGGVDALYIMGTDPVGDDPAAAGVLGRMALVVVQELFPTATTAVADVVLPALSAAEMEGTFTSFSRRVQPFDRAATPVGEARADWQILRDLGTLFGATAAFASAADVMAEVARVVPPYAEAIGDLAAASPPPPPGSVLLPFSPASKARAVQYHGTAYTGRGIAGQPWATDGAGAGLDWQPPRVGAVGTDSPPGAGGGNGATGATAAGRPLLMVAVPRLLDAGTMMRSSTVLHPLVHAPHILVSPFDARPRGLAAGTRARVEGSGGALTVEVRLMDGLTPGVILAPEGLAWETPVRSLLGGAPQGPVTVTAEGA